MNQIATELGTTRHSVNRHMRTHIDQVPTSLALSSKEAANVVAQSARDLASSQRELVELIDDIVDKARGFLDKFGESDNARDIKAALDCAIAAARLLGDKQGAFPKAASTVVDSRSIHLSGLDKDSLQLLIAGLKQSMTDAT